MIRHYLHLIPLLATTLAMPPAVADEQDLERRIAELEQTVRLLERKLELADEVYAADKARAAPNGRVKADATGVAITGADSAWDMKFRGVAQFDGRFFVDDDRKADSFLFRRLRPTLEAKFGPYAAFRFTPEFANDDADLIDGYLDVNLPAQTVLRAGQFKAPVGLERLQSAGSLIFTERAFPTELAPNRDRGVQLSRFFLDRRLSIDVAFTSGAPDGRDATNSDGDGEQEWSARAFFEPVPGIGFGVAGSRGNKDGGGNAFLPRYRSPGQQTIFAYRNTVSADGEHTRWSPQAYAFAGPFGVMAEYIESRQALRLGNREDAFTHDAFQVTGVWSITGEPQGYRGIRPEGRFGAFELALRYAELDVDNGVFAANFADLTTQVSGARELAIGFNWTITPQLKAFTNFTHTRFSGGAASGADRPDEQAVFTRLQLNF